MWSRVPPTYLAPSYVRPHVSDLDVAGMSLLLLLQLLLLRASGLADSWGNVCGQGAIAVFKDTIVTATEDGEARGSTPWYKRHRYKREVSHDGLP